MESNVTFTALTPVKAACTRTGLTGDLNVFSHWFEDQLVTNTSTDETFIDLDEFAKADQGAVDWPQMTLKGI